MTDGPYENLWASAPPPPPPARRRRVPRLAVAAGITGFGVAAGAGIAAAFTGPSSKAAPAASTSSTTTTPVREAPHRGFGPGRFGDFGPFGGPGGPVVHGQFTVRSGTSYKTIDVQTGTVKSVSSNRLTVTSSDGFTATYAVEPSTVVDAEAGGISTVVSGDEVQVEAVAGNPPTATDVVDTSRVKAGHDHFFGPPPGPAPTPAA